LRIEVGIGSNAQDFEFALRISFDKNDNFFYGFCLVLKDAWSAIIFLSIRMIHSVSATETEKTEFPVELIRIPHIMHSRLRLGLSVNLLTG